MTDDEAYYHELYSCIDCLLLIDIIHDILLYAQV